MQIALLDNKKSIAKLVEVDTNKSILEFIENELKADSYNFIVTTENLPFAKKQMAELNKSIKHIDTFRKDKVSVESVAIDVFKDNVKKYLALIDLKREEIKKNVEVFEKETKDKILKELSLYCEDFVKIQGIRDNFLDIDIVDLIVLGSVTGKGSLTKKAKETIESRVNVCKSKQDKYDMRLMQLENLSYQNGLESPLTITHIQGIISLDSDAEYETRLNELISSEMGRQKTIKDNLEKQADIEAQQKVIKKQNRIKGMFTADVRNITIEKIDSVVKSFYEYDFSEFNDFIDFARDCADDEIEKLQNIRNDLLADIESKQNEIPTTHETIPFTQEEKSEQVKENLHVEDDRKVVRIKAVWAIEVPIHVPDDAVLNKVSKELEKRDAKGESFESLEVV